MGKYLRGWEKIRFIGRKSDLLGENQIIWEEI
jgi:hypothetical protein